MSFFMFYVKESSNLISREKFGPNARPSRMLEITEF